MKSNSRRKYREIHNFVSEKQEKQENGNTIKYKIRFTDSVRSIASSLSSLADSLAEGLHKGKSKDC